MTNSNLPPGVKQTKVTDLLNSLTLCMDLESEFSDDPDIRAEQWQELMHIKTQSPGFGYLVESIMEYGITQPLTVVDNQLENGHHRLVAAILLGLDEVPISTISSETNDIGCHLESGREPYPIYI